MLLGAARDHGNKSGNSVVPDVRGGDLVEPAQALAGERLTQRAHQAATPDHVR